MLVSYQTLKTRQRAVRENYPEHLSFRVDRALRWLNRAEQCDEDDGRFIFCGWHLTQRMPMKPLRSVLQWGTVHQT
jgi:hypothetical protein